MRKIFLILCLLLWALPAQAAVYWAVPSGGNPLTCGTTGASDPGSGYTTFATGLACLSAGDTLMLKAGTYTTSNGTLTNSGTSFSNPITIKSAPGAVVTFTGNHPIELYNNSNHHVIIDGSDGNSTPCSTGNCTTNIVFDGHGVVTRLASFIRWKGVEIKNSPETGWQPGTNLPLTIAATGMELINSRVHNNGTNLGGTPQHHGTYNNGRDAIIEGNDIYSNCGAGIHAYTADPAAGFSTINDNQIIRNNRVRLNGTCNSMVGILFTAGANQRVYNNIVHDNNGDGIRTYNTYPPNGAQIYNNTVYNNTGTGLYLFPGPAATGTIWRNNISHGNTPNANFTAATVTASNNLCTSVISAQNSCLLAETAATTFINPGTDFNLKTGSAAINAGTIGISPGINIPACSGGTVLYCYNGALPDLGALETGVPTAGGGPPTMTPNPAIVAAGAPILLTVDDDDVNERVENSVDWIGLYVPGADIFDWVDWTYMNSTKIAPATAISDAVVSAFTAPLTPGSYEFRFYQNGSALEADRLATAAFTVITPGIVMKFNISTLKIGPSVTWKIGTP